MKYIGWLVVVFVSFALGQVLYPAFEGMLMAEPESGGVGGSGGLGTSKAGKQEIAVETPVGRMTIPVVFAEILPSPNVFSPRCARGIFLPWGQTHRAR